MNELLWRLFKPRQRARPCVRRPVSRSICRIGLFARNDNPLKLTSIAQARSYRVGSYIGDAYGDYVERQGVPLDRTPSDANNLPKLMSGHIDLWVAGCAR